MTKYSEFRGYFISRISNFCTLCTFSFWKKLQNETEYQQLTVSWRSVLVLTFTFCVINTINEALTSYIFLLMFSHCCEISSTSSLRLKLSPKTIETLGILYTDQLNIPYRNFANENHSLFSILREFNLVND